MTLSDKTAAVLCAGGTGSRMWPATHALNKHLLPLYNKPLAYYPLSLLMLVGVRDICMVTNPRDELQFRSLFSDGRKWGISIRHIQQATPNGIVGCLSAAAQDVDGRNVLLMLGDNFFYGPGLPRLVAQVKGSNRAVIFCTHVSDSRAFARVETGSGGEVLSIEEKPPGGGPGLIAAGLYYFPADVWQQIGRVTESTRGEMEITSVIQIYLDSDRLDAVVLPRGSVWLDCGTAADLQEASNLVKTLEERGGHLVGSPEEIAWRLGWISDDQLRQAAMTAAQSDYARKLLGLLGSSTSSSCRPE